MNVTDLKKVFKVESLNKDEILFKEGETDGEGYIIETGTISLIKNNINYYYFYIYQFSLNGRS